MIRISILLLIAAVGGSVGARIAGAPKKGCLTSIALEILLTVPNVECLNNKNRI